MSEELDKKSTCSILEHTTKHRALEGKKQTKINDNALASIALLVAQSHPDQKEIIIKLVINMLYEGDV
ncbi:hypothetical protein [Sulfurospirillum sp. 1612]|uniref:hypothetical protein n=1 Tax=Sulfurospirillum sp. 1612 TaxID=3094835 RepID=UPI002F94F214